MKKRAIAAFLLALSSGIASAQSASSKPGWYAGLDLGRSRLGVDGSDIDGALANQGALGSSSLDQSDTSFGINGGFRFNRNFAVEAAWERLGDFSYSSSTGTDTIDGKFKANAVSLAGVGIYPFTPNWSIYGKAGIARTSVDLDANSQTGATAVSNQSHDGVGALFGAGSTGRGSIDTYSVGVGMRF